MKLAIFAATVATAAAFVPASTRHTSIVTNAALSNLDDLKALATKSNPVLKVIIFLDELSRANCSP